MNEFYESSFESCQSTIMRWQRELKNKGWEQIGAGAEITQKWKAPDGKIVRGIGEAWSTAFPEIPETPERHD